MGASKREYEELEQEKQAQEIEQYEFEENMNYGK